MCFENWMPGSAAPAADITSGDFGFTPTPDVAGSGIDWGGIAQKVVPIGMSIYGANQQAKMGQGLADAQNASYQQYLDTLNPSAEAKEAQFNALKSQVTSQAPIMRRKLSNQLASRGVRGQGLASPISSVAKDTQSDINNAYFNVYGKYNTPSAPPPVNYAPSTGNIMGKNVGDIGMMLALQDMFK